MYMMMIQKQKHNCRKNKKRPVLVKCRTGDVNNVQEAAMMPTGLLDMREA
jgi:hypothetical protein